MRFVLDNFALSCYNIIKMPPAYKTPRRKDGEGTMNKKLTVRTEHGRLCYCVMSPCRSYDDQLSELFGIGQGGGLSARLTERGVELNDYFHAENVALFKVLSLEDTELDVSLKWTVIEE